MEAYQLEVERIRMPDSESINNWEYVYATLNIYENEGVDPRSALSALLEGMSASPAPAPDTSLCGRFQDRLETNYLPAESERRELLEFCQQGRQLASRILWELDMVHSTANHLHEKLSSAWTTFGPFEALISPMRAIPPEILQEIFLACLPANHGAVMHVSEVPLLLGRVCRMWRSIALATASLWASVHISVPEREYSSDAACHCEALQMWLQRSGSCPLSISLAFPGDYSVEYTEHFIDILLSYHHRWKELKLFSIPHEHLLKLRSLMPRDLPLLETVEITHTNNAFFDIPNTLVEFMPMPPRLRRISLCTNNGTLSVPLCPWLEITTLCLQCNRSTALSISMAALIAIIEQCLNLQECNLVLPKTDNISTVATSSPTNHHSTLNYLHSLAVAGPLFASPGYSVAAFLDHFILPALRSVHLGERVHQSELRASDTLSDTLRAFGSLLSRSSCDLQKLYIEDIGGDIEFLVQCLQDCPSLQQLELWYGFSPWGGGEQLSESGVLVILKALTANAKLPTPPTICPMLSSIRLSQVDVTAETHPAIVALLKSRCLVPPDSPIVRLQDVQIKLRHTPNFVISELTKSLTSDDAGQRISIQGPYLPSRLQTPWSGLPTSITHQYLTWPSRGRLMD
ncbi:hypothetical protein C8J57DRAFT_1185048 [Mycena rebaudengoi]|nr:hypothetical protein C8J57DRAFT_1185048 [Mycena rebaudengoi]